MTPEQLLNPSEPVCELVEELVSKECSRAAGWVPKSQVELWNAAMDSSHGVEECWVAPVTYVALMVSMDCDPRIVEDLSAALSQRGGYLQEPWSGDWEALWYYNPQSLKMKVGVLSAVGR